MVSSIRSPSCFIPCSSSEERSSCCFTPLLSRICRIFSQCRPSPPLKTWEDIQWMDAQQDTYYAKYPPPSKQPSPSEHFSDDSSDEDFPEDPQLSLALKAYREGQPLQFKKKEFLQLIKVLFSFFADDQTKEIGLPEIDILLLLAHNRKAKERKYLVHALGHLWQTSLEEGKEFDVPSFCEYIKEFSLHWKGHSDILIHFATLFQRASFHQRYKKNWVAKEMLSCALLCFAHAENKEHFPNLIRDLCEQEVHWVRFIQKGLICKKSLSLSELLILEPFFFSLDLPLKTKEAVAKGILKDSSHWSLNENLDHLKTCLKILESILQTPSLNEEFSQSIRDKIHYGQILIEQSRVNLFWQQMGSKEKDFPNPNSPLSEGLRRRKKSKKRQGIVI